MALSQTSSSQMICDLTVQRRGILGSQNAMNAVEGATIERRIRISRPDDENTRCKVSRAWDPRKDFSQSTLRSTTQRPTPVSSQQERTEPLEPRRCRRGAMSSLRREPSVPAELLRALCGNVTKPPRQLSYACNTPSDTRAHSISRYRTR